MILHEINHKMPIYKDCTLGEILCIGGAVFFIEIVSLSLFTRLFFGYACIGSAFTLLTFWFITKYALSHLQKVKYGKPFGFYQQLLIKKLLLLGVLPSPYLFRKGRWSIRRTS